MNIAASLRLTLVASLFALFFFTSASFATCGGGGGGGAGGASPASSGEAPEVYRVPWKIYSASQPLPTTGISLLVLWFPVGAASARESDLLVSRTLTQIAARCVADALISPDNKQLFATYKITPGQETVVLAAADGSEISRVTAKAKESLEARAVEKMIKAEVDARQKKLEEMLKAAEAKAKTGDKSAMEDLQKVWSGRCLFPSLGKRAAKSLKKLGTQVSQTDLAPLGPDSLADSDIAGAHADVEATLKAGLTAEIAAHYQEAGQLYQQAVALDPADTTALRFLGEFYRHETGEWDKAGRIFYRILDQPADPIARAVALHGLGKMTIHSGRFEAGLALFAQSLDAFPLPITYRNLAVYWYSEKQTEKAAGYMRQAIALAPNDRYNQIFAAVYLAATGHKDEALEIARANEQLLEASYNLAAIWAQAGDRAKAMELLRRHFYAYERYDAVRSMEMKEAREDYMFTSLHKDAAFADLTKLAKNAWMLGKEFCAPDQLLPVTEPPGPRNM